MERVASLCAQIIGGGELRRQKSNEVILSRKRILLHYKNNQKWGSHGDENVRMPGVVNPSDGVRAAYRWIVVAEERQSTVVDGKILL